MPWSAPTYTGGVVWQDLPSHLTPLNAADLNTEENAEATYSASVGQSVVNYLETDPVSPLVGASGTRNRALRDFRSVLDYGTYTSGDMTSTFASAVADVSAKGTANGAKFKLHVPPNAYQLTSLAGISASYVDIHAHGASFTRPASYAGNQAFFWISPITHFAIRGLAIPGTGTELPFQALIYTSQSSYITIEDCEATNVASFLVGLEDSDHLWVERNKVLNGGTALQLNAINFVNATHGSTNPLKHFWARDNIIENWLTIGINVVSKNGANRTDPEADGHITGNTCTTSTSSVGWPIAIEQGGSPAAPSVSVIDISGNRCVQNGTGNYGIALTNDSTPPSADPLCISEVTVEGNRIKSNGRGILCEASYAAIVGNAINAATDDIALAGPGYPSNTATIHHIAITGNPGHRGTGNEIAILGGVDTTTLTSTNTP